MLKQKSNKQMSINLIASLVAFCVNIGINFFLTPYLVNSLGTEAYGFIGLSADFVQYGTIITTALNSMAGRFISVSYHRGKKEEASVIFSSVLVANLILSAVLLVFCAGFTLYIDLFLEIPKELLKSVQITFAITFLTFIISVITAIFTTATFVKNRLEIDSIRDIISNLFRVAIVVALFSLFDAKLYFLALAGLGRGVFLLAVNFSVKKKLLPDVEIKFSKFNMAMVKVLLLSGIWMSVGQLSTVLMNSVDLLICNLSLSAELTGLLSVSKTIPLSITVLIVTLSNVFTAQYTIIYSKNKIEDLVKKVIFTSKIPMFIMLVPIAGFMVFGREFYALWQPSLSADEITMVQLLSVIACVQCLTFMLVQCYISVFTVANKLKIPVLINIAVGVASVIIVIFILKFGNLGDSGVYIIAGTSAVLMSIRALTFVPMYSAKLLGQKLTLYYPTILRGIMCFAINILFFYICKNYARGFFGYGGWISFIAFCGVAGICGYVLNAFGLFSMKEIKSTLEKLNK